MTLRVIRTGLLGVSLLGVFTPAAHAADRLCDPGLESCRAILIDLIRKEHVGIDVAFWFMEDQRFSTELIRRWQAGVPVRVLFDPRASDIYPLNAQRLSELRAAGIPMRERATTTGILHWKMMLFAGQNTVEFSGANFSADAWAPISGAPLTNYIDEAILFTDDSGIVNSFRTKYDDLWLNTTAYRNHANIGGPLIRRYGLFPKDPRMNFPPADSFANRSVANYDVETQGIDVIMFRITDPKQTLAILAARARGVPVRLITEPTQYRPAEAMSDRNWFSVHAPHVDLLYRAGVQIRHRAHAGMNHQKSVLLRSRGMTIFGSSNWNQDEFGLEEHNLFTTDPAIFQWFSQQFERKWHNAAGVVETEPFVPLPPHTPKMPSPEHLAASVSPDAGLVLKWVGGPWAQLYDLYMGLNPNALARIGSDMWFGPASSTTQQQVTLPFPLPPGTTLYWQIVGKTLANVSRSSDVWSFTTAGVPLPPPPGPKAGEGDAVIYAAEAALTSGAWEVIPDGTAAGGSRLAHADAGAAKLSGALAQPTHYFELTFQAVAGKPYRLWLRAKADHDNWTNDSVFVQFSGAVTASGAPLWRIGSSSATVVVLEECGGCGLSGWGWQDNGYGPGVLGQEIYFQSTGAQTIRIQTREDGLSIDQIVLSQSVFLTTAPGALKNDATIVQKASGLP